LEDLLVKVESKDDKGGVCGFSPLLPSCQFFVSVFIFMTTGRIKYLWESSKQNQNDCEMPMLGKTFFA